jgi:hypothetical protein
MPIYEVRPEGLHAVASTSFEAEGWKERGDIQRLLKDRIATLEDGLLVLTDEFSGWTDSARRIDLLCLDRDANLVVVELKRNEDGGHMELQALRYAAMVAAMTFDQAVETLARQRSKLAPDTDAARIDILTHLGWSEPDEESFAAETRIILAAADFGKELTTCVLWLRDCGIDIGCVRLKPYRLGDGRLLVDIQPLIPLPEAAEFQTQIGVKQAADRKERAERHDLRYRFWARLLDAARLRTTLHANRSPQDGSWIAGGGIGRKGFSLSYVTRKQDGQVELKIEGDVPDGATCFAALKADRSEVEQAFGGVLDWEEPPAIGGWRICHRVEGGYRNPEAEWPAIQERMIDAMIRLDAALRPRIGKGRL